WRRVDSPFGEASDELCFGTLAGTRVIFLPRHGRGHRIPPSEINFRANVDALKRAGATELLSLSAVGSLKAELPPGTFVLVDQFIDRTYARSKSFFGTGLVAHVAFGHPVCGRLVVALPAAHPEIGQPLHRRGSYLSMQGPQFPTLAQSQTPRRYNAP